MFAQLRTPGPHTPDPGAWRRPLADQAAAAQPEVLSWATFNEQALLFASKGRLPGCLDEAIGRVQPDRAAL